MISYDNAEIQAIVTTVGSQKISFEDSYREYGLSEKEASRLKKNFGFNTRHIVSEGAKTSDLCMQSANNIFENDVINRHEIDGIIFVTQSPNFMAPSTSIYIQDKLGLRNDLVAFDVNLGCSGFINGLNLSYSLINSGLKNILLMVGDVASNFVEPNDHTVAPIMGDAGSAILISAKPNAKSIFTLFSDGSGHEALIVNDGNFYSEKFNSKPKMIMDGKAVFNFTIKRVPSSIEEILSLAGESVEDIDLFVLHQPNSYILKMVQKKLGLPEEKIPMKTQSIYGNQNSASIPGTISGFLNEKYSGQKLKSLFCGFGIGLSWGCAIIETDKIYCPNVLIQKDSK